MEHSAGTQFIKNFDQVLKRQIIKDGDQIIEETLKKVRGLDIANLSDEELLQEIVKLRSEVEKCDNLFIKGLLAG